MIKKLHLTIVLLALIQFTIQGQTQSFEFGEITKEDLESKEYLENEDAAAIVLYDIGKSYFEERDNAFELHFERSTRIKILSEAGAKWAEVEIPFYKKGLKTERIFEIEAYAYNIENGEVIKTSFNKSNTFDEKVNNLWNVRKFAIPNVREGTIIEYRYRTRSPFMFNLNDWEFQWKIPVVYSEYEVSMIPFYEYSWLLQGATEFDSQTSFIDDEEREYGSKEYFEFVHQFIMKDIPAFDSEEYITSVNDYVIKLDFQLSKVNNIRGVSTDILTTWEDMNKELLENKSFGKYVNQSERLGSRLLKTKSLSFDKEKEKFDYLIKYVKGNYTWNKRNGMYTSKTASNFVKDKFGNSADVNLFTIGLLNAAGIEAKPILISTRGNGTIKYDYPYTHFFNYVVILAKVDGVYELTDATEILNKNNRLPIRALNDKGLVIQKDKVEWVSMENMALSELRTDIQIELSDKDTISSIISKTATEYDALLYRNSYSNRVKNIKEKIESKAYTIVDSSIVVKNQLNFEEPYILTYQQTSKPEVVNEKIYLSPLLSESVLDNPLKQKERNYPINMMYPQKRSFNATILIPEDYEVDYLPSERIINNQLFELTYTIESDDKEINISFDYEFKTHVYFADTYSVIKSFFDEIVKKGNEKVVLSKK